jgi:hypothetical protein
MRQTVFGGVGRPTRSRSGVSKKIVEKIDDPSMDLIRVRDEVRTRCAEDFNENRRAAVDIINNTLSSNTDKLRALDMLGKYGGLQQVDSVAGDGIGKVRNIAEDLPQELLDQIEAFLRR